MDRYFFMSLAASNLRKNSRSYVPYILTCSFIAALFYITHSISENKGIDDGSVKSMLMVGAIIAGIFSVIFLFYTNSFLIKRRQKEFGIFNILGMDKKHICCVMVWETAYTAVISITLGLIGGIVLSKLMFLVLLKLMHFDVNLGFEISQKSVLITLFLFTGIFVLTLLNTVRIIHLYKPVELLSGGQKGEKEPKSNLLVTLVGVLSLGGGYYIALFTESPLSAISMFFLAVFLVMVGTYCLFTSGSITFLKLLRRNKKYFYKTKHFISVSGMIYRMKQNAVGLGNICILSTAVLVSVSTTVSLYIGMDDVLRTRFYRNIIVRAENVSDEQAAKLDDIMRSEIENTGVTAKNIVRQRYVSFAAMQNGSEFLRLSDEETGILVNYSDIAGLKCILLPEYNKMTGKNYILNNDEVFVCNIKGNISGESITVGGTQFTVKERIEKPDEISEENQMMLDLFLIVVPDAEAVNTFSKALSYNQQETQGVVYEYGFDTDADNKTQIALTKSIRSNLGKDAIVESAEASREEFYALYGGMLFLGIFLGLLFIIATVLIIYYKQISEGFDDKERFDIMQKVGMSKTEVKNAIRSQVFTVFFLPLVAAAIHIAAAFRIITKILAMLNLTNVPLFAICTVGTILVFAIFYAVVYAITARSYYKIVY